MRFTMKGSFDYTSGFIEKRCPKGGVLKLSEKMQSYGRILGLLILVVLMATEFPDKVFGQECEMNCKTKCSPEGQCICNEPTPESLMMGNRNFSTGVFCDEPAVMCDGTNSFWCQNGGICNELVQGENYTCTCPEGFTGEHCNLGGLLCENTYCYNGGTCTTEATGIGSCECPEDFLGSDDCSVPTPVQAEPASGSPVQSDGGSKDQELEELFVPLAFAIAFLVSLCCICCLAIRYHRQRGIKLSQHRFHELRQVQMNNGLDFYDDGDDDDRLTTHRITNKASP